MFERHDPAFAGRERRILGVIHPLMFSRGLFEQFDEIRERTVFDIEVGSQSTAWYVPDGLEGYHDQVKEKD